MIIRMLCFLLVHLVTFPDFESTFYKTDEVLILDECEKSSNQQTLSIA